MNNYLSSKAKTLLTGWQLLFAAIDWVWTPQPSTGSGRRSHRLGLDAYVDGQGWRGVFRVLALARINHA